LLFLASLSLSLTHTFVLEGCERRTGESECQWKERKSCAEISEQKIPEIIDFPLSSHATPLRKKNHFRRLIMRAETSVRESDIF
jgi:hypothetical protein